MGTVSAISDYPVVALTSKTDTGREGMRRRHISPEAGRALEILGHAIEYLADEFIRSGESVSADNGQVESIQLLMGINRQIYFAVPGSAYIG